MSGDYWAGFGRHRIKRLKRDGQALAPLLAHRIDREPFLYFGIGALTLLLAAFGLRLVAGFIGSLVLLLPIMDSWACPEGLAEMAELDFLYAAFGRRNIPVFKTRMRNLMQAYIDGGTFDQDSVIFWYIQQRILKWERRSALARRFIMAYYDIHYADSWYGNICERQREGVDDESETLKYLDKIGYHEGSFWLHRENAILERLTVGGADDLDSIGRKKMGADWDVIKHRIYLTGARNFPVDDTPNHSTSNGDAVESFIASILGFYQKLRYGQEREMSFGGRRGSRDEGVNGDGHGNGQKDKRYTGNKAYITVESDFVRQAPSKYYACSRGADPFTNLSFISDGTVGMMRLKQRETGEHESGSTEKQHRKEKKKSKNDDEGKDRMTFEKAELDAYVDQAVEDGMRESVKLPRGRPFRPGEELDGKNLRANSKRKKYE